MEPFLNIKYKLERCDNLDELLREMGESERWRNFCPWQYNLISSDVNAFLRKIASSLSTTIQLVRKGDEYTLNTKMLMMTTTQKFKLGEEKDVTTTDGRKIKNVFTIDGNVLTEQQIGDKTLTVVREFAEDEMIATSYYGNVVCKAYCKPI